MKKRISCVLGVFLALAASARGEAYVTLEELRAQAPLVWEAEYQNLRGETVLGNASVVLPETEGMPVYQVISRPTDRTDKDRGERTGYCDFFFTAGEGNLAWEWKVNPPSYDVLSGQAENNPFTQAEAWAFIKAQAQALYGVELDCGSAMATSVLYETHKNFDRGKAISKVGQYWFDLWQIMGGVPVFMPTLGSGVFVTPADYRFDLNLYDIAETVYADVPLLPWKRISALVAQEAQAQGLDPVFKMSLGYVLIGSQGNAKTTLPVWAVWAFPEKRFNQSFESCYPTSAEQERERREYNGLLWLFINAQSGEITQVDMWNRDSVPIKGWEGQQK